jgi:hypothetical protein
MPHHIIFRECTNVFSVDRLVVHNKPISRKNIGALPEDDVVKRRNTSK